MLELNAVQGFPFANLLVKVNNKAFVLGMNPNVGKKYVKKLEKGYIDLVAFNHMKHYRNADRNLLWNNGKHPEITILEEVKI